MQAGQLNEYTERKDMSADVVCMALAAVPSGEQRSRFLAVGLADNTVRIISLDPNDCLTPLSMQALPDAPESLCIAEMGGTEDRGEEGGPGIKGTLYLNIGLTNGEPKGYFVPRLLNQHDAFTHVRLLSKQGRHLLVLI